MAYDERREIQEAIAAGERALDSLYCAQNELHKAKNWGFFDMLGGGFLSGLIKHSKMGNAQRYMEQAKWELQNFSRELRDVDMICELNLDSGDLLQFADLFFDGLFADWMMQDRINNAIAKVDDAIRYVDYTVNRLHQQLPY